MDALHVYLEPSVVVRVAAELFEFDPIRTVVPPLVGLNVPELRSAMLAVDAELRAGGVGGQLLAESLATILSVHLIRHTTGPHRLPASADGVLARRKLHTVIEYIRKISEAVPRWSKWPPSFISAPIILRASSRRLPGCRRTSM